MSAKFAAIVRLADLDADGTSKRLDATADQLEGIAGRLGVERVSAFAGEATVRLTPEGASVSGHVRAALVRSCVVTLEPVEEIVEDQFELRFARGAPEGDIELSLDEDWPDLLEGDAIDVAEILVEQVALAMNPYPRKPGAAYVHGQSDGIEEVSPFAVLRNLKKNPET